MAHSAPRSFLSREDGAVTVEFVIIFPILVLMLMLIVSVSLYIATASEVQQVAHELARASFRVVNGPAGAGDLCLALNARLSELVESTAFLNLDRFAPLAACPGQPDADGAVTVTVAYDLIGSTLQAFGENVGFTFGLIERHSTVRM